MIEAILSFLEMGEHGVYVWSAWVIALLALAAMAATPWLRWRAFLKRVEDSSDLDADLADEGRG